MPWTSDRTARVRELLICVLSVSPLFGVLSCAPQLLTPAPLLVRVYALRATGVQPLDDTTSDPFLTLRLGSHKINDQEHYVPETVNPEFYR
jgi:hypothetical protein